MSDQSSSEVIPPQRTGNKATVVMKIEVMVEVHETDSYSDMVQQAHEELRKRVVEGKGFVPYLFRSQRIYTDVTVDELRSVIEVRPGQGWRR